jgi:hypothetical protein
MTSVTRSGSWFPVPRRYLLVFKHRTANFILSTLNMAQTKFTEDGFVMLTPKFVEDGIGLSRATQEVVLRDLERLGIVEVRLMGFPKTRHVRLHLDRLEEVLSQGDLSEQKVA